MTSTFTPLGSTPEVALWMPLWNERRPGVGLEHARLTDESVESVILCIDEQDEPCRIEYNLTWDEEWHTRGAEVRWRGSGEAHSLRLTADGRGNWWDAYGEALAEFQGCLDIDIWPTPFTNTLPIRRLNLAPGERRAIEVVWVSALTGEMKRAQQAYSCRAADRFLFESLESDFAAELQVDAAGLVIQYPGLFRRVGTGGRADGAFR